MIIPGRSAIPTLLTNLRSAKTQTQPCGVDLTLKHVSKWTSPGIIDFSNALRLPASSTKIPFLKHNQQSQTVSSILAKTHPSKDAKAALEKHMRAPQEDSVFLDPGSYLVQFNETVSMPLDLMGQIFVRSSLFRSGALLNAGVMDSGYKGAVGAMLQVVNPHGLLLFRDARLAQMVFHEMSEEVEGYSGVYQGSGSV